MTPIIIVFFSVRLSVCKTIRPGVFLTYKLECNYFPHQCPELLHQLHNVPIVSFQQLCNYNIKVPGV